MDSPPAKGSLRSSSIVVAIMVMNLATYVFTMVAARLLGPGTYGAFAAVMNVLLVVNVTSLGIQAAAARRIAAAPGHVEGIERDILAMTTRLALALGALLLLLSPLVDVALRLDNLFMAALVGLIAVPLTVMGGQAGVLQGERRWLALAMVYVAAGVPRLLIGTTLLVWRPTATAATVAVLLGAAAPVLVGAAALRRPRGERHDEPPHPIHPTTLLRETFTNSQALLAFFVLSNLDIIIARNVLSPHEAGLYAAGIIMVKAVLFLPQFVVVLAFPSMSTAAERSRALVRSLVLVTALGVTVVAGVFVLRDLALVFVGGPDYAEIRDDLWGFALLGTVLALLQLLVYAVLARQGRRSIWLVWLAVPVLVVGSLRADSTLSLLTWVTTVDALLVGALLVVSLRLVRQTTGARSPTG